MKIFNVKNQVIELSKNPSIIASLNLVEFYHGKTYKLPDKIKLNRLRDISKRRSVTSSNEIENIKISKKDEIEIFDKKRDPITDEEKQLIGYNDALEYIFTDFKKLELDEPLIKYLHELEWKRVNPAYGGEYKDHRNYIREFLPNGESRTVFIPVKPADTPQAVGNLVWQFNDALNDPSVNRLLLIFVFVVDFLCIHPFNDGNGRVSRLLTTFLLMKFGYELDRYYSISYLILNNLANYYDSLEQSSTGWYEDKNDYSYFSIYMLGILIEGYKKLDYILSINEEKGILTEKILKIIRETHKPVSKADIEEILFNNKRDSIEEALGKLIKSNKIILIQKGKYSLYKLHL
ncbi:MAG: Fic family protein [Bacilli bacterium]|nr:Fic family protein [Bacilli bacterium]